MQVGKDLLNVRKALTIFLRQYRNTLSAVHGDRTLNALPVVLTG